MPANANGVLYALAGFSGGVTCYVKDGYPVLRVQPVRDPAHQDQVQGQAAGRQGEDRGRIEAGRQDRRADGRHAEGERQGSGAGPACRAAMSLHFTSNATFDIGSDLDSPVSLDYYDQAPFRLQRHHRHDEDHVSEEIAAQLRGFMRRPRLNLPSDPVMVCLCQPDGLFCSGL